MDDMILLLNTYKGNVVELQYKFIGMRDLTAGWLKMVHLNLKRILISRDWSNSPLAIFFNIRKLDIGPNAAHTAV